MAKVPEEHRDIHREADKREPAMERAATKSGRELAAGVNLDELELAIGTGDINKVLALFPDEALTEAYAGLEELVADAWLEGNLIAEEDINEFLEEAAGG